MNLRQRRGVMFLGGSLVFLIVGASALSGYVSDVNEQVGPLVEVAVLARDVDAYTPLTGDDLDLVEVPERWVPDGTVVSEDEAVGLVVTTDLGEGVYLAADMLEDPPELGPGEREVAILIDAETGVAGKVSPGSRVDIVATFTDAAAGPPGSEVIVSGALVLEVGDLQPDPDDEEGFDRRRVVPITFALTLEESLILTHAESFADRVRLALTPPGEPEPTPSDPSYNREDADAAPEGEL